MRERQLRLLGVVGISACLLFLVGRSKAAPSVSGVSGTVLHGNSIAITGTGFGTKSPAAPVLWDTIDNQSAYSSLDDGDDIPVTSGYPWSENSTYGDKVEYCDSRTARGQETAHYHWMGKGYLGWPRAMDTHTSNDNHQFYAYYWWKPSWDPNDPDGTKFMRVWDNSDGTDTRISWTSHDLYAYSELYGMNREYGEWSGDGGEWNSMEIWVDADAQVIKAWVNCDLEFDLDDFDKVDNDIGFSTGRLGMDPRYGEYYTEMHNEMADIYIDVTQARVYIGDSSTYSGCSHREMQIPIAWSASSITATVNQGSFSDGQAAYLYVVDSDGNADPTGYPITVGDVTFALTVTNGSGSGEYDEAEVVAIAADPAPSGKLFAVWIGDIAYVADRMQPATTVTMPAGDMSVTATYAWGYELTVNSGSGGGLYLYGSVVDIEADPAATNMEFDAWTGDLVGVADIYSSATTVTMPSSGVEVTATYELVVIFGDLDGDGFVGQGDLDIILADWGNSPPADPRADPSGDGSVGQADLDIVLDNWGEGPHDKMKE